MLGISDIMNPRPPEAQRLRVEVRSMVAADKNQFVLTITRLHEGDQLTEGDVLHSLGMVHEHYALMWCSCAEHTAERKLHLARNPNFRVDGL